MFLQSTKNSHYSEKNTMETRIIKNIFNKNERRCRDVKTQKASISTALCILFYSSVSTYVGLYGGDFGSYVSFPTLFACFLGFDIPTSSFIFIENVFYYSIPWIVPPIVIKLYMQVVV